jgi:hypothetical protein
MGEDAHVTRIMGGDAHATQPLPNKIAADKAAAAGNQHIHVERSTLLVTASLGLAVRRAVVIRDP